MKKPLNALTPLAEDPTQPSYIRELIDAGRNARVSDYDYERGLRTHMTRAASGAPMPEWAQGLRPAAGATAAAGAAGKGALSWILGTALAAIVGVTGALIVFDNETEVRTPAPSTVSVPQPVAPAPRTQPHETAAAKRSTPQVESFEPAVRAHANERAARFAAQVQVAPRTQVAVHPEATGRGAPAAK